MSSSPILNGTRLGSYEILALLGEGGMGAVYRARDTKLGREVAIKVLLPEVANDPERLARFRREATVLASLNHPNIAQIYGLEEGQAGQGEVGPFLAMELVEGSTLAEILADSGLSASGFQRDSGAYPKPEAQSPKPAGGGLPIEKVLNIARQIAEALEAAHEQTIVHRDLKPANIKVRPDGTVKLLDFGLAKAIEQGSGIRDRGPGSVELTNSPTITSAAMMTGAGVILGTAAYMSPEQARGQAVDRRADVWAFGCVLFEMLTGRRAFEGTNVSDVVAGVLRGDPDWNALPTGAAPLIAVLRRCLHKDPRQRLRDIGDLRLLLDDAMSAGPSPVPATAPATAPATPPAPAPRFQSRLGAAAVLGLLIGGGAMWSVSPTRTDTAPGRVQRFTLASTQSDRFAPGNFGTNVAISPDGTRVVYTATRQGIPELMMRRLDQLEARPIPGTDGAFEPFFSPDGQQLGFATFTELKRVPVAGGPSVTICRLDAYFGGAVWGADDEIVFTGAALGIFRVPATGGAPERLAVPDSAKGEQAFVRPATLPGAGAYLYTVVRTDGTTHIVVRKAGVDGESTVVDEGFGARYLPSGHLVYGQGNALMAVIFDTSTLQGRGTPVQVEASVATKRADGVANVVVADNGTAVYVAGKVSDGTGTLVWLDSSGKPQGPAVVQPLEYPRFTRLSPDGRRLALTAGPPRQGQIWVYDLAGSAQPAKLTVQDHNLFPVWSPDGKQIAFMSRAGSVNRLLAVPTDGSVLQPRSLIPTELLGAPLSWSPDHAFLLVGRPEPAGIWLLRLSDGRLQPFAESRFSELAATLSSDGKWMAYSSDQTGTPEVWARPFPGPGVPVRVSSGGGTKPLWSHDTRQLFYENGSTMMAAPVLTRGDVIQAGLPRVLFEGGFQHDDTDPNMRYVDVAPDGRFIVVASKEAEEGASVVVAQHWDAEVKRLLPSP